MKLLRYGPKGQEKPGLLDQNGKIRDLSKVVDDIAGAALSDATLAKLRAGQPVKIAFMGASVSVGAEAPIWYAKKPYSEEDHSFRGRFVYGLQQRFPKAQITPIEAFKSLAAVAAMLDRIK